MQQIIKKEYLFIRGINKTCGDFVKKLNKKKYLKVPKLIVLLEK